MAAKKNEVSEQRKAEAAEADGSNICGLIMPIASIDGRSEGHWQDVKEILSESALMAGYDARIVSDDRDAGLIHKRIVDNLYSNPVVVCDVSAKNPNVMFELGMRLTFDKPVVVVKDDETGYSFDTSPIQHLEYPRDLRYSRINLFKEALAEKINDAVTSDRRNSFLGAFGTFKIPEIPQEKVSGFEFFADKLVSLENLIRQGTSYPLRRIASRSIDVFQESINGVTLKRTEDYITLRGFKTSQDARSFRARIPDESSADFRLYIYRPLGSDPESKLYGLRMEIAPDFSETLIKGLVAKLLDELSDFKQT